MSELINNELGSSAVNKRWEKGLKMTFIMLTAKNIIKVYGICQSIVSILRNGLTEGEATILASSIGHIVIVNF